MSLRRFGAFGAFLWISVPFAMPQTSASSALGTTASWLAKIPPLGYAGAAVSTAGDVNGDGFADVIVGNPYVAEYTGLAAVYHGSGSGLNANPAWMATGDTICSSFGWSVSAAGDVNGDGFDDVVVGAPLASFGSAGLARLYHGSAAGVEAHASWEDKGHFTNTAFGYSVATAGDVDSDGFADLVVSAGTSAALYRGAAAGLESSGTSLTAPGGLVATAGDVNGDGFADVLAGGYAFHGSSTGLFGSAWSHASQSAAAAGDVNGDGYGDVIVGSPHAGPASEPPGRVEVFHGSATGLGAAPAWSVAGEQAYADFGASVAAAGDVNGDGFADVIVGAPFHSSATIWSDEGRAFVYLGSAGGLGQDSAWTVQGIENTQFGVQVATAGDVNGDGFDDALIGALYLGARVFHGGLAARAIPYGAGKPGTHGVPMLASLAPPVIGATTDLTITNALPGLQTVLVFVGAEPAQIPFDGGAILNDALAVDVVALPFDANGAISIPVDLPYVPGHIGMSVHFQLMIVGDPGAAGFHRTAQTNGLEWTVGS